MTTPALYPKAPRWAREYARYCPEHTDGASRHVKVISGWLRKDKDLRGLLAGYDLDHWASTMEKTVLALWRARKVLAELKAKAAK